MTGGQAQIDAESQLAADAHGRLESLLRGTRTEECRKEVIGAFQGYMGAQALVSTRILPQEILPPRVIFVQRFVFFSARGGFPLVGWYLKEPR